MFRYIALVWDAVDDMHAQVARSLGRACGGNWRLAFECPGLTVYCAGSCSDSSEVYPLDAQAGLVLGTLFAQTPLNASTRARLGRRESQRILTTQGAELVRSYWGRYVAFIRDSSRSTTLVVRDPSGAMPCFVTTFNGVSIYFSAPDDCALFDHLNLSIDWDHIFTGLATFVSDTHRTGLKEVSRVLGGECIAHRGATITRKTLWDPCAIAGTDVFENLDSAALELRRCVRDCVQAWASCYDGIVHLLSGGLDSSIVLSCLQDMPSRPRLTCLNWYYLDAANSDERQFARLAAQHADCRLIEREADPRFSIEGITRLPRSCAPYDHTLALGVSRMLTHTAQENGASALFAGNGGDQLFYKFPNNFACTDYVARHGIGPHLFRIAFDTARLRKSSLLQVLRHGIRDGKLRDSLNVALGDWQMSPLLSPDIAASVSKQRQFLHPWLQSRDGLPPGKVFHILSLSYPFEIDYCTTQAGDPAEINPLFSQPVIELCLRTPVYVLTANGWDRSVARTAFAQDVPDTIIRRRTKCVPEEYGKRLVTHNIKFIRELILEGLLAKQQVLDRKKVETTLCGGATKDFGYAADILKFASAEAWVRSWSRVQRRAAA